MKRACLGYRDQLSLAFRDETRRTQRKARKTKFNHRSTSPIHRPSTPIDRSDLLHIPSDNRNLHQMDGFGKHLPPPLEDSVVCHFYETTAASLPDEDHARYLHLLLPDLYNRSSPYSPLRLAAQAISYATSAKSRPNLAQRSSELYGQAISALNSAIRDPNQVKNDQTLYAVLLLSGHQVSFPSIVFRSLRPFTLLKHILSRIITPDSHIRVRNTASIWYSCRWGRCSTESSWERAAL